jgi:addiction module antidote protein, HigA family
MNTKTIKFPHPGEILEKEFLEPMNITQYRLAKAAGISHSTLTMLIQGKRAVSVENAVRIGKALRTGPEFWINLQKTYDLRSLLREHKEDFENIECLATA